jgi:PAS domain S-box-containing protein
MEIINSTEKDFLNLLEVSYDLVFVCEYLPDFRYTYVSEKVINILGYSSNEIYDNPEIRLNILHKDDAINLRENIRTENNFIKRTYRYAHKEDKFVWLDTSYSFIKNEKGEIVRMMGLCKDVSEEYNKEFELNQHLSIAYDLINKTHGIILTDIKMENHFYINDKACDILKCTRKGMVGNSKIRQFFVKHLNSSEGSFNSILQDSEENDIYLNISYASILNSAKDTVKRIIIFEDVTKERLYEMELINQKKKLDVIFNTSGHMIWTVSENMTITSFNDNFFQSSGKAIKPLYLLNNGENTININNPNYELWIRKYAEAFAGETLQFEINNYDHDHNEFWAEVFLSPVFDSEGKVQEVSGIAHNITEIKKTQLQLMLSLKEKEVLLSEIHHRVKNNLQVIISILNLQSFSIRNKKAKEYFKDCQERVRAMAYIHETLYRNKDFSNIKFDEYVKSITNTLLSSYGSKDKKIDTIIDVENVNLNLNYSIPCGLILNELVSNSLKYAFNSRQKGCVKVFLKRNNNKIDFKISDDGIGLPAEIDFKATETLGLQLVVTLVEQLNGKIELSKNSGTEFLITFSIENNK